MPVPTIMVTVAVAGLVPVTAPTVQMPAVPVMVGAIPASVVAVTVKVELRAAPAGAPVKVTVGASFVAVVDWVAVATL